ncbi:glycosyltransferase family 4 protein [Micromonospora sp. NPDC050397]|uniref:glycosyltransferase family 4 protein n=1 Tax=Micromonospora sp. NPDC050397 TaxID=3364279 RepID=UPI00384D0A78
MNIDRRNADSMRIAHLAPLFLPIPPRLYGGAERVISLLVEEQVRRGHDVTLFASGDSVTGGRLVPVGRHALWHGGEESNTALTSFLHTAMFSEAYQRADEFDIIHSHYDYYALPFARSTARPTVSTLYGRLDEEHLTDIYRRLSGPAFVSISRAQWAPLKDLGLHWAGCVPCAVPVTSYQYHPEPGKYLLFVGRIAPEKRPDLAVQVARAAGLPLKVSGVVHRPYRDYWDNEIRPLFESNDVEYVGEISDSEKSELYGGALATLFPSDWPEAFGLVMVESLACGTPVIALDRGAVREVIQDGVHGFIRADGRGMAAAVPRLREIDRSVCRQRSLDFTPERMALAYESIYSRLPDPR